MKNNKGMTVVEVLVAISIVSIIILVTYSVYIGNAKHIWKAEIESKLQNEAQIIESTFSQLSMQTKGIELESEYIHDGEGYYDVKYLVLQSENSIFNWSINGKELKLNVKDKKENIFKENLISENIESFKVRPIDEIKLEDSKIVEVDISLRKQSGFNDILYPISMIVTFRNK